MSFDLGILLLRVFVGLVIAGHGSQKLFGWFGGPGFAKFAPGLERMGFRPGWLWGSLAIAGEVGGGLGLAVGLLAPLPAVGIVAAMAIATFKVHWKNGFWASKGGYEYPLMLLLVSAVLGLLGPGRYSLDAAFGLHLPIDPVFLVGVALAFVVTILGLLVNGRRLDTPASGDQRAA